MQISEIKLYYISRNIFINSAENAEYADYQQIYSENFELVLFGDNLYQLYCLNAHHCGHDKARCQMRKVKLHSRFQGVLYL